MILTPHNYKKFGWVFSILLLLPTFLLAQEDWVDLAQKGSVATEKNQTELAIEFYNTSLSKIPEEFKNTEDHAWLYLDLGASYGRINNTIAQERNYDDALAIALKLKEETPLLLGSIYNHLGVLNANLQQEKEAIKNYKLAIPFLKEAGYMSRKNALVAISNLINSYSNTENIELMLETMRDYLSYVDKSVYSKLDIWENLYTYGNFAKEQEDYELAQQFYEDLAYMVMSIAPEDGIIHYYTAIFLKAEMDRKLGNYWSGIYDLGKAVEYIEQHFSEKDSKLLGIYRLLAEMHGDNREPDEAAIYYNKVLELLMIHQPDDIAIQEQIKQQLHIYMDLAGDFRGAARLELSLLKAQLARLDATKIETLKKHLNVAQLHIDLQEYRAALKVVQDISDHPKYDQLQDKTFKILAVIALKLERLKQAEVLFLDLIEKSKEFELEFREPVEALNGLGEIYQKLGNYEASKKYYSKVFNKTRNSVGYDFEYEKKTAAIGLADVFINEKRYDEAVEILNEWITKKSNIASNHFFKGKNFMQGRLFTKLAESYIKNDIREKAIIANDSALYFKNKSHSENHLEFVPNLLISARVASQQSNFQEAQEIIRNIRDLQKEQLDDNSLDVMETLLLSQQIAITSNNTDLLQTNARALREALITYTNTIFEFKSEEEKKLLIENTINPIKDILIESAIKLNNGKDDINKIAFEISQFYNGIVLNRSKNILNILETLEEDQVSSSIAYLSELKLKRAEKIATYAPSEEVANITASIRLFESKLNELYYIKFPSENDVFNTDRDLTLTDDETLLSFAQYKNSAGETKYICFVINKAKLQIVTLFTEKELNGVLSKSVSESSRYLSRYGSYGKSTTPKYGAELYKLIWEPLEKTTALKNNIFYIPVGLLKTISFAAIPVNENTPLIHSKNLYQLTNAKEIPNITAEISQLNGLLIGGIDYNAKADVTTNSPWSYLPGTKTEIDNLQQIFESSTTLMADQATEKNFVSANHNQHNIIHIASHGFFNDRNENQDVSIFERDPDPMMRSGLIFAGANDYWNSAEFTNNQDGILTSLELSTLNLSTIDLFAMSACETGLGDIEGSEGVYGLQRGVKMAGVQSILMSLWEVPDVETSEFMSLFYKELKKTKNKHDAFINTQRVMYRSYPEEPQKWSAFVLID